MELRHLRYFVAVAEDLSFRRAALRVHVAQPALGRQIRDLEEELGASLFDRDRRHVSLTDAGRALLPEARRMLGDAAALVETVRGAARGVRGTLRIGNVGQLTSSFLPDTLATFREAYPGVDVELRDLGSGEQRAGLAEGTIQLGFLGSHELVGDATVAYRSVVRCGAWAILPARHRLADQRSVALKDLADESFLTYMPRNGGSHEPWLQALCSTYGGFTPHVQRKLVDHFIALFGMVAARAGITVLPTLGARSVRTGKGWVTKRVRVPNDVYELAAVWKAGPPSPLVANFLALLRPVKLR